jgi:hypothetical protein
MTKELLIQQLREERVVALDAPTWTALAGEFTTLESHDTCLAGELRIISTEAGPAAVEQPKPDRRVVRLLNDEDEVRRFVQERLDTYDRMWDGCGCKVDYYN